MCPPLFQLYLSFCFRFRAPCLQTTLSTCSSHSPSPSASSDSVSQGALGSLRLPFGGRRWTARGTRLSLPSRSHRVLWSCVRVFGVSVTLKSPSELGCCLHCPCTCCSAWPRAVGSVGLGPGSGLCLRGQQGAGRCGGVCECGDPESQEGVIPTVREFLQGAAPVRRRGRQRREKQGNGWGAWSLRVGAPATPTKGRGPQ